MWMFALVLVALCPSRVTVTRSPLSVALEPWWCQFLPTRFRPVPDAPVTAPTDVK